MLPGRCSALLVVLGELFSAGARPIDTGAAPVGRLQAGHCAPCHPDEFRTWQHSRHAVAWSNELFQRDYRHTGRPWCRNCHIPLQAQHEQLAARGPLLAEGVNCAACHVRDGDIVARARRPGSPHRTRVEEEFGSPRFCAGCHQFPFPVLDAAGAFSHHGDEPMQDTVAQFSRWAGAPAGGCLACHGDAGHRFPGAHDPAMLARALSVALCREPTDRLRVTVRNVGAGHHVPTGDVHRHLLVQLWRPGDPARLQQAFFGRRFALTANGARTTTWDSTLAPGAARRWRVPLAALGGAPGAGDDEPVSLELLYVYGPGAAGREAPVSRSLLHRRHRPADLPRCPDR
jgi:hypothetical protein